MDEGRTVQSSHLLADPTKAETLNVVLCHLSVILAQVRGALLCPADPCLWEKQGPGFLRVLAELREVGLSKSSFWAAGQQRVSQQVRIGV